IGLGNGFFCSNWEGYTNPSVWSVSELPKPIARLEAEIGTKLKLETSNRIALGFENNTRVNTLDSRFHQVAELHQDGGVTGFAELAEDLLASASWSGAIWIWDLAQGTVVRKLDHGARCRIACMAFLGDHHLAAGDAEGKLRVWDTSSGKCLHKLDRRARP